MKKITFKGMKFDFCGKTTLSLLWISFVLLNLNLHSQILFSENFATSLGGMTAANSSNGAWVWTNSCARNPLSGHSQTGSAYFLGNSANCEFGSGGNTVSGNMVTPPITIGSLGGVLTFNYSLNNECGTSGSTCTYDVLRVAISNNGGTSFTDIYSSTSSPGGLVNGTGWAPKSYTLNAYSGQTILIRFNFNSIDGAINNYDGVYIDDILVEGFLPCTGTPTVNTVAATSTLICPMWGVVGLNSNSQYGMMGGIQYTWYASTVSAVGPFTAVPNATLSSVNTTSLPVTTWYQAVITCANSSQSNTTAAVQISVEPATTNVVPYYEGFENIQGPDRLPNCSWSAVNLGSTVKTSTASNTNNRVPRNGNNFMTFSLPSTNNYVFTNGIQMEPGVTYSAALHFATEYFGYSNWTDLSIFISAGQTTTNLIQVKSVKPAISGPYKELGGLFTVPSSGLYNMVIRATGTSGSAPYLNIDDISVTIPCTAESGNLPNVSLATGAGTSICQGQTILLNATGADTYSWNTGVTTMTVTDTPSKTFTYTVWGTNTLTGCVDVKTQVIEVLKSPTVFIVASKDAVCPDELIYLTAYGADSYLWNGGPANSVYTITPSASGGYTVSGTNINGCSMSVGKNITVYPAPPVSASALDPEICVNEVTTLAATGAVTFQWMSSSSAALLSGSSVNVSPNTSSTYTVIGTDANGCEAQATVNMVVEACVGVERHSSLSNELKVYPNPAQSAITIEYSSAISQVEIVDLTGRVVRSESPAGAKTEINISQLAQGVYYAKITVGGSTEVIKVVKQ